METTPIDKFYLGGGFVFVKREDLFVASIPQKYRTAPPPTEIKPPPFAKPRGLVPELIRLRETGVTVVGYMDTTISMAGWALSYYAPQIGLHPVILFPKHKSGLQNKVAEHAEICRACGAEVVFLEKPTQLSINWYRAQKIMKERYNGVLLPQGLPFSGTVQNVMEEVRQTYIQYETTEEPIFSGTLVVAVGSGTMAAGILSGLSRLPMIQQVIGVLVSPKDIQKTKMQIIKKACCFFKSKWQRDLKIVDPGYNYTELPKLYRSGWDEFPCNPYYDLKAWEFLVDNISGIEKPIIFWNIGG